MTFEAWLQTQPYRPNTSKKTLTDVRYSRGLWEHTGRVSPAGRDSLRRYALFLHAHPPGRPDAFERYVATSIKPTRLMTEPHRRKLAAQSFANPEWSALVTALEQDPAPEATVLLVMTATGHRIADILRISRRDIDAAKRTGLLAIEIKGGHKLKLAIDGAPDVWDRLSRQFRAKSDENIALWVSRGASSDPEAGSAGYKRCARYLKKICAQLGIHTRVHLHRVRRTVAVKALDLTGDLRAVQDLLGHHALSSTLKYVDEFRYGSVAELQRQLRTSVQTEDTAARIQAQPGRAHSCNWPGCKQRVGAGAWACPPHWGSLPAHLQDLIRATYRHNQVAGKEPQAYLLTVNAITTWIAESEAQ